MPIDGSEDSQIHIQGLDNYKVGDTEDNGSEDNEDPFANGDNED